VRQSITFRKAARTGPFIGIKRWRGRLPFVSTKRNQFGLTSTSRPLTQQGLASKLKVSRNTVARWERDEMAIPGFLHLALKTLECEAAKASKTPAKH